MTEVLARCTAVSHRFGATAALASVDLCLAEGEMLCLLGANGAGKTTLIRILLGLLAPSAGTVLLFGEPRSTSRINPCRRRCACRPGSSPGGCRWACSAG